MISKKAEKHIEDNISDAADLVDKDGCGWAVVGRYDAYRAIELAEDEMIEKAAKLFNEFITGILLGNIPRPTKMTEEFKQKLMEE